ncbi:hypothetical protein [Actinacidiphila bryophytorum]|uniref:Uncharacterized protein n=1 Tax=Actinacidiphila bryophytorum TaxID=1436133 RepID=A0A9W4E8Y2_9ACTN|nr:hypothetical protein [Actinacidiphila bryophytorum]MBM9440924.1 hypothetical protein [Actinacidiphila bryophytorum]MBN6546439.1 hypothetical protein [Actinacidiphila bryophytorum]CAG7623793.1 conserved hypothetical protein [Actinacidiphila bryophytorum]
MHKYAQAEALHVPPSSRPGSGRDGSAAARLLSLQCTAGNAAVTSLLRDGRTAPFPAERRGEAGKAAAERLPAGRDAAGEAAATAQRVPDEPQSDAAGGAPAPREPVHYRIEAKAWIPQARVVDPESVLGVTTILGSSPRALEQRMLDSLPPGAQPTGYLSHYRGDDHTGYAGSHRVVQVIEFDWDGERISNVTKIALPNFGASHRDVVIRYFDVRALDTRWIEDSESATATESVVHTPADSEVSLGIHSANPLTMAPSPDIDADLSVFLSSDPTFGTEEVTVRWSTDLMPSHGFRLVRDGVEVTTETTNDIAGMTPTGPAAAAEIFIRLNSKSNGGSRTFSFLDAHQVT